ncbi:DUF4136 domain-containing protein [Bizionia sp. KMM 8389]
MKSLKLLLLLTVFTACGVTVDYDYQSGTDFTLYKTYNYFDDMETGFSPLDAKRFFQALDSALQKKGLQYSETPDFIIDVASTTYQSAQTSSVGMGVGSGGGGISVGIPVGQGSISRRIVLDFVDSGVEQQLFWQGVANEPSVPENTPDARTAQFEIVIQKLLEKYPPNK